MESAILKHNFHWKEKYTNLLKRDMLDIVIQKWHLWQIKTKKKVYLNDNGYWLRYHLIIEIIPFWSYFSNY